MVHKAHWIAWQGRCGTGFVGPPLDYFHADGSVVDVVNTTLGILKDLQKLVRQRGACGTNKLMQRASPKTKSVKLKYIATLLS